jgi:hypothetical protein
MKGILESIPEFLQVVIGIAVAIILFGLIYNFTGIFKDKGDVSITGKKDDVAKKLATFIEDCWKDNREGLAPDSKLCKIVGIKPNDLVTESNVVKYLNCNLIPNNECESEDCSNCVSDRYENQDRVKWDVTKKETKLKITYSGSERVVYVEEFIEQCDNRPLMTCKDRVIAAYFDPNLVVLTDISPLTECCSEGTLIFFKNVAKYFGGSDILIIWESDSSNPQMPDKGPLRDMLTSEGFNITSFKHTETITTKQLIKYDQVWIFRPGWCVFGIETCTDFKPWNEDDVKAIKEFSKEGKIFLITDWDPTYSYEIPNSILSSLGFNSKFENTCGCGCEKEESVDIIKEPLTNYVKEFKVEASSHLVC